MRNHCARRNSIFRANHERHFIHPYSAWMRYGSECLNVRPRQRLITTNNDMSNPFHLLKRTCFWPKEFSRSIVMVHTCMILSPVDGQLPVIGKGKRCTMHACKLHRQSQSRYTHISVLIDNRAQFLNTLTNLSPDR
jgi:hypothetical protein